MHRDPVFRSEADAPPCPEPQHRREPPKNKPTVRPARTVDDWLDIPAHDAEGRCHCGPAGCALDRVAKRGGAR